MIVPIPQFTAPSYGDRTLNEVQRCMNFYPEKTPHGYVLISHPGLRFLATSPNNLACRGAYFSTTGKLFSAHGTVLYEVDYQGAFTSRGSLASSSALVTMADDGLNLLIAEKGQGGYTLVMASGSTVAIADSNFPIPSMVTFQDGYFIVGKSGTGAFYLSQLLDPTDWTPVQFATAESKADTLLGVYSNGQNLYLLGSKTLEIWYNTGNPDFPFERINGAIYNIGTTDGHSLGYLSDRFFFFGSNDGGRGTVWEVVGTAPNPISTPSVENALSQWVASGNSIIGFCYQTDGHSFYEVTDTTSPGRSWIFDIRERTWSERDTNISSTYSYHRVRTILNAFTTLALPPFAFDILNGNLYTVAGSGIFASNADSGVGIRRIREFGPIESDTKRVFHSQIRIELEMKFDATGATSIAPTLDWTDDGGLTYSTAITMTKTVTNSTTGQRVLLVANRLGSSASRYYRLTFTGPAAKIVLKKCELDIKQGRF